MLDDHQPVRPHEPLNYLLVIRILECQLLFPLVPLVRAHVATNFAIADERRGGGVGRHGDYA